MDGLESNSLGRFGKMRKTFLKEHHSGLYQGLLMTGKLSAHLLEIDRTADERMEQLTASFMDAENVTEALKATDQMDWLQRMNSIRARAEEIVMSELIYS
jgi:hypothetical protein